MIRRAIPIVLLACAPDPDETLAALAASDGPELDAVTYLGDWDTDGVELTDDGFTVISDLGYTVEVTEARLVDYTLSMVSCHHVLARMSLFGSPAWAGHPDEDDPSTMLEPAVQHFADPGITELGSVSFATESYCRLHSLIAAEDSELLPDSRPGTNYSLVIAGEVTTPEGAQFTLHIASNQGLGRLDDFDAIAFTGTGSTAEITVTRRLETMFDGIALDEDPASTIAWRVLSNLSEDQTTAVHLR
jgi:hypothetical protein